MPAPSPCPRCWNTPGGSQPGSGGWGLAAATESRSSCPIKSSSPSPTTPCPVSARSSSRSCRSTDLPKWATSCGIPRQRLIVADVWAGVDYVERARADGRHRCWKTSSWSGTRRQKRYRGATYWVLRRLPRRRSTPTESPQSFSPQVRRDRLGECSIHTTANFVCPVARRPRRRHDRAVSSAGDRM